jgi:PHD/YefM family antitoxin component YafN of YafNO toxin-antitoxin module
MLDISRDVDSLSSFKRNTPAFLRRLKKSGRPVVLTINGKPALVVQDPASYQQLLERAQRDKELEITQQSIKEMEAGLGRPAEDMLAEMRQLLDRKRKRSR